MIINAPVFWGAVLLEALTQAETRNDVEKATVPNFQGLDGEGASHGTS